MTKKQNILVQYFITFILSSAIVFALCLCAQLELLFRCENDINTQELAIKNLSKFLTIEQLEKRLQKEPKNYIITIRLAKIFEDLGDYDKANDYFLNALKTSSRSNFALYNYALFCAKRRLYSFSASYSEELSGNNNTIFKYKAKIYETVADNLLLDEEFEAAVKAYQIAYKYARTSQNEYFLSLVDKLAKAYITLAEHYIQDDNPELAIVALQNSLKIKDSQTAKYMLALIYCDTNKIKAEKLLNEVFEANPYMVNPYVYNKLLVDLINESLSKFDNKNLNYYSMKLDKLKRRLKNYYIYKDDILITSTDIVKQGREFSRNKKYFITFDIKNNTNQKISQLYVMVELFIGTKKYVIHKKVIKRANPINFYEQKDGIVMDLPHDFEINDLNKKNSVALKYYAKKQHRAPWTLVKIEAINF